MIIKQKTGRSVSDIIADMIIMDAKSQLMATDLTIQEISYSLNFPNVSFFGKYFKRYVGVSPQKFRNS
jgi:YesN/AraC family two-component response regulator